MCNLAAKALLEHLTSGPARITDLAVCVLVDFRVDTGADVRHRFEIAMMAVFDRPNDAERFDACSLFKRDGSYGVMVRFDLPNFSARFFPRSERLGFFHRDGGAGGSRDDREGVLVRPRDRVRQVFCVTHASRSSVPSGRRSGSMVLFPGRAKPSAAR